MNNELEMGFERKGPIWKIIVVAAIAAGVQFGWALQLSLLTPYVQTLGVPHTWAAIIWLCGPISGLFVQPVVGYYSDHCTSRFGRRRPFIVAGSFCISVAIFFIGFAKDIGYIFGDPLDQPTKPRGIALFVFGFWILDVANNMLQGPCRAFLADLSANSHKRMQVANACFSFFMAVGNVMGYAAGSYPNLYKLLPFTKTVACDTYCANLKTCFIIDVFFLSLTISSAVIFVKEQQYIKEFTKEEIEEPTEPFFKEMANAMKTTKKPMRILLLVTCLNWISWFPFLLYDTDWMGKEIYGGSVEGSAAKKSLYDQGVRAGALGLMINSIVLGFNSLGTERAGKYVGGVTTLWGGVNFILAAGLAATVWITRAAEAWRAKNGSPDVPPPADIRNSALAVFGILGVPLSVTFSVPFALASIYSADSGAGQGLSLGLLNMAIVIPQMFVSVISGPLDAVFGGGNLPAFVLGSFGATISGALAIFVLPRPKKQPYVRPTLAGGH